MGGWNSGRNNRGAGRCESWHRVELTYLRKHKFLRPGRRSTLWWHRGGKRTGSIGFYAFEDHAELRYSRNGENVVERIGYLYTSTNFDARRMWFACPNCHRACGVIYGGRRFYCRICWQVTYASQYEADFERARSKAAKIRARLGQRTCTPDFEPFPDKPKSMRWKTYHRLSSEDRRLCERYEMGFSVGALRLIDRFKGKSW